MSSCKSRFDQIEWNRGFSESAAGCNPPDSCFTSIQGWEDEHQKFSSNVQDIINSLDSYNPLKYVDLTKTPDA